MDPQALQSLLEELDQIDRRSYQLALDLLDAPAQPETVEEAATLADRLAAIADELKMGAPESRRQRSHQISEATVDLERVQGRTRFASLRIGRRMRERAPRG